MIDLHFHSTFSDGSHSPEALADLGAAAGLTAMALTDHDTIAGVRRFLAAAESHGIRCVPGVELSLDVPGSNVHMLAYGCDLEDAPLNAALARVRDGRHRRNVEILSKLSKLGCNITWPDVLACAGEAGVVGRPHFAQALIEKGYARSKHDAFSRLLGKGGPAYVERSRLGPEEAIALIRNAGGVAVLAHPTLCGLGSQALEKFVGQLVQAGLGGIETYYTGHGPSEVREYISLARTFDLVPTGGSDFHGALSPNIELGVGYGSLAVPDASFDALLERMALNTDSRAT